MLRKFAFLVIAVACLASVYCSNGPTGPGHPAPALSEFRAEKIAPTVIQLSWKDNGDGEAGFIVERKRGFDQWDTQFAVLPGNSCTYVDVVEQDYSYWYRLYAFAGDQFSDTLQDSVFCIQFAVDKAAPSDTILVPDGVYYESLVLEGKYVVLASANGPANCIIDGRQFDQIVCSNQGISIGYSSGSYPGLPIIRGFTIRNFSTHGISCYHADATIEHNIITNNGGDRCGDNGGIRHGHPGACVIRNNLIYDNNTNGIAASGSPLIINNVIAYSIRRGDHGGCGICCMGYGPELDQAIIINNIIYSCEGYGLQFPEARPPAVSYCCVTDSISQFVTLGQGCITNDPIFLDPENGDFHLDPTSPCVNAGAPESEHNDPDGSRNDMGAYGGPNGNW